MVFTVIEELSNKQFHSVYVVYGEETFLIEQTIRKMKEAMLHPDWAEMNYSVIDLTKQPLEVVIEEAESYPFGDGRRLVIAQNCYFLTGSSIKGAIDQNSDSLLKYLQSPADFSSLVLVVPNEKLDERKKIVRELQKRGRIVQANILTPKEWEQWIRKSLQNKGVSLDESMFEVLLRYLPNHLQIVDNELEKLALYVHSLPSGKLDVEQLKKIITKSVEGELFDMIEKIANRNFQAAFEIYRQLIKQNEEPIKIIALLARQFRLILQCKMMHQQGYTQKQIASQLKVHPYPVKLAIEQGMKFSSQELCEIIDRIASLDYGIKTGKIDRYLGLEMLLLFVQSKGLQGIKR